MAERYKNQGSKPDQTGVGFIDPAPLVSAELRTLHPQATKKERRANMSAVMRKHRGLPPFLTDHVVAELVDAMGLVEYRSRGGALGQLAVVHV